MSNKEIKALYENYRLSMLIAYRNGLIKSPLAYAYTSRIPPVWDSEFEIMKEHNNHSDPFEGAYVCDEDFTNSVLEYVDKYYHPTPDESKLAFNVIEDNFGGYKAKRMELVHILRYAFLHDRFSPETFSAIMKDAPSEAYSINKSLNDYDITV